MKRDALWLLAVLVFFVLVIVIARGIKASCNATGVDVPPAVENAGADFGSTADDVSGN